MGIVTAFEGYLCNWEALFRLRGQQTCTPRLCDWILSRFQSEIDNLPIKSIDFMSAERKNKRLDSAFDSLVLPDDSALKHSQKMPPSIKEEFSEFSFNLSKNVAKLVVLSVNPEYSERFVPTFMIQSL